VSGVLALSVVVRRDRSLAHWAFSAGMLVFAATNCLYGFALASADSEKIVHWQSAHWVALALIPGPWLLFSLCYSRGNYREFVKRWKFALAIAFLAPPLLSIVCWNFITDRIFHESNHWILPLGVPGIILDALL